MADAIERLTSEAGLMMKALINEEVEQAAGLRYAHLSDRHAVRWDHDDGQVTFGGRKVAITFTRYGSFRRMS